MKKHVLAIAGCCFLLNSCVIFGMTPYEALQVGEYELADAKYNTLAIYTDWNNPIISEPLVSASLSIDYADASEFGKDPEVVESLETTNRYVESGDTIRYRRLRFKDIQSDNHVITDVCCKLLDLSRGWAKPATQNRKMHRQVYSVSFQFDGIDFKTGEDSAGYIEQDYKSYAISLFGQGVYQGLEVSCSIHFKVKLNDQNMDSDSYYPS